MNINTNIGLRDRSRITLSNFKGLDTLSATVDVSAIHATDMKNLISRDGVNHKRFGWKTQFRIRDDNSQYLKIQGIFDFTIYHHERFLIVYAGKKFWLINRATGNYFNITNQSLINGTKAANKTVTIAPINEKSLTDTECKFFINKNKVYFLGCGDYLVFSKWDNGFFELRRVVDNIEDVYIPTTTENIGCEDDKHYTRITAEERNLLSPYTYNTLFGKKELLEGESAIYYLDSNDFIDISVEVERQGQEPVVLKRRESIGEYVVGQKIENTCIEFNSIQTETSDASLIQEKTVPQTVVKIQDNSRWYSYEDACEAGFPNILGASSSERARACREINDKTGEEYGTYQNYLDAMYEQCLGVPPNTVGLESLETSIYYTYEYSANVSITLPNTIKLIDMENGESLVLKCYVSGYDETSFYGAVESVNVYYAKPLTASFTLCYIKENGETIKLNSINNIDVNCNLISVEKSSENIIINSNISFNLNQVSCDLTNYNAVIKTIYLGAYANNESVQIKDSEGAFTGQVVASKGLLILNGVSENVAAYSPLVPDVPNIRVKLTRKTDENVIVKSLNACKFGTQGVADRLFVVDASGNTIRWSKDEDFTYFGEKSWCICGTSDKRITGIDRLNDSTLLIGKEYSPREPSIFIITGNIVTGETEAGTVDYTALFTPHGYQVGIGAVGEVVNFNGDCLMVAKDGLYAVSLGENMTVDSRYVLHRSRQISNKLEKFDLASAKCISFNGKLFVAVGGEEKECYVADNKYTTSFEGDIQNVVNYEWWRWTNIPVSVWGFVGNELWFGTNDGELCCFTENFYDETFSRLYKGLITYALYENEIVGFTLGENIKITIGDIFTPTCDFYGGITTNKFECIDGETRFYLPLNDYLDGETIYIDNTAYIITKHDLYFSILFTTELTELTIYRNYKNKPLTVMDDVGVALKDRDNNFPKWSAVKSQGGLNPANDAFTATLSHKETVVSKWVSGAMDLGTRAYSKSLTYLVLTGEKDLANRLKYGLKTRFTYKDYELLRANNDNSFEKLDLQTLSLDSNFASSYTKRLNIRDVNFLMFYFVSDEAEDVALNSIQIEFKINKRNIGAK